MIAIKRTDYVIYFDDNDLSILKEDAILKAHLMDGTKDSIEVGLIHEDNIHALTKSGQGYIAFADEIDCVAIHLYKYKPLHKIFFDKKWFLWICSRIKEGKQNSATMRWNQDGDKLTILVGENPEVKRFKSIYE